MRSCFRSTWHHCNRSGLVASSAGCLLAGARARKNLGQLNVDYNASLVSGVGGTASSQTVTFTAVSGTVGATIQGRLVTVATGASDYLTMLAFISAVLNDAVIGGYVTPHPDLRRWRPRRRCAALWLRVPPGANALANAMTLALSGTGVTVGGATFAGGVNATAQQSCSNG